MPDQELGADMGAIPEEINLAWAGAPPPPPHPDPHWAVGGQLHHTLGLRMRRLPRRAPVPVSCLGAASISASPRPHCGCQEQSIQWVAFRVSAASSAAECNECAKCLLRPRDHIGHHGPDAGLVREPLRGSYRMSPGRLQEQEESCRGPPAWGTRTKETFFNVHVCGRRKHL